MPSTDTRYSVLTELKANRKIILLPLRFLPEMKTVARHWVTCGSQSCRRGKICQWGGWRGRTECLCMCVWVLGRWRCNYVHVRTCMSKVRGAVSKHCGCQFETHPGATASRGYLEHQFEICSHLKMRLFNPHKCHLTSRLPCLRLCTSPKGDSGLRPAKRSSRCEGML